MQAAREAVRAGGDRPRPVSLPAAQNQPPSSPRAQSAPGSPRAVVLHKSKVLAVGECRAPTASGVTPVSRLGQASPPAPACPCVWPALSTDAQARRPGRRQREACKMGVLGSLRVEPPGNPEGRGTGAGGPRRASGGRRASTRAGGWRGDQHAWVPSSLSLPSGVTLERLPGPARKSNGVTLGRSLHPREPQFLHL